MALTMCESLLVITGCEIVRHLLDSFSPAPMKNHKLQWGQEKAGAANGNNQQVQTSNRAVNVVLLQEPN